MNNIPVIENIHQKVRDAVSVEGAFDMSEWHKDETIDENGAHCGKTHCRAGHVVFLAGKAGRDLENHTSTEFAAIQIYKASSPIRVSPVRFYETNKVAMADINKCADAEIQINKNSF